MNCDRRQNIGPAHTCKDPASVHMALGSSVPGVRERARARWHRLHSDVTPARVRQIAERRPLRHARHRPTTPAPTPTTTPTRHC